MNQTIKDLIEWSEKPTLKRFTFYLFNTMRLSIHDVENVKAKEQPSKHGQKIVIEQEDGKHEINLFGDFEELNL